jgi:hypothetical protein
MRRDVEPSLTFPGIRTIAQRSSRRCCCSTTGRVQDVYGRVSKFAFVELDERITWRVAADLLRRLVERAPYRIHTVLSDTGYLRSQALTASLS